MALNAADTTSQYLYDFKEHIDSLQKHLSGVGEKPFSSSFIPPSGYWTPSEKERFFHSLSVNSRSRPDLIAFDVETKTVTDVCLYIELLERAAGQADCKPLREDLDIAMTVPDKWVEEEDRMAGRLEDDAVNLTEGKDAALALLDSRKMKIVDRILQDKYGSIAEDPLTPDLTPAPAPAEDVPTSVDSPDIPEAELSPKSRRRLYKRLHMRRKRASQKGVEPDLESDRLQPGKKSRRGRPPMDIVDETPEPGAEDSEEDGELSIAAGRNEWEELGIDADELVSRGLGLFNLASLRSLMSMYSVSEEIQPSSISGSTVQLLETIVKDYVTRVIHHCIVLGEEQRRLKGQTKVWSFTEEVHGPSVHHALASMNRSTTIPFEETIPVPHHQDTSDEEEEDDDDDETRDGLSTYGSSTQPSEFSSHSVSQPNNLPPTPPGVFFRLPEAYANANPDDLMAEDTDEEELLAELDEEMELNQEDLTLELEHTKVLDSKYNLQLQ